MAQPSQCCVRDWPDKLQNFWQSMRLLYDSRQGDWSQSRELVALRTPGDNIRRLIQLEDIERPSQHSTRHPALQSSLQKDSWIQHLDLLCLLRYPLLVGSACICVVSEAARWGFEKGSLQWERLTHSMWRRQHRWSLQYPSKSTERDLTASWDDGNEHGHLHQYWHLNE